MALDKVLMILPPVSFDYNTYIVVRNVLQERGHQVRTASVTSGAVQAAQGNYVPIDVRLVDVKSHEYEGLVFIGGDGSHPFFDDPRMKKVATDLNYKRIAATDDATVLLAMCNILSKKRATGPFKFAEMLVAKGAKYTGTPLEQDDKLVTLRDPALAQQFATMYCDMFEK